MHSFWRGPQCSWDTDFLAVQPDSARQAVSDPAAGGSGRFSQRGSPQQHHTLEASFQALHKRSQAMPAACMASHGPLCFSGSSEGREMGGEGRAEGGLVVHGPLLGLFDPGL